MALLAAHVSLVPATTATFAVTATVEAMCNVSTNPLVFGAFGGAALTAASAIVVTCTNDMTYNVRIGAGLAAGATVTNRQMNLAAGRLRYSLLSDANHSVNWGQSVGVDTQAGTGTGYGNNATLIVYGQVAVGQVVNPGS